MKNFKMGNSLPVTSCLLIILVIGLLSSCKDDKETGTGIQYIGTREYSKGISDQLWY
ncbi:MAG: hypothetical protein JW894_03045 [Bacteroidales bacterium]|nr:hypothetical protein [Bacteroidales bacterium]